MNSAATAPTGTAPPMPNSPFLRPSNPRMSTIREHSAAIVVVTTRAGGETEEIPLQDLEKKSSLWGAYANLCNVCIGAGIVGLPYAIKEAGLASGTVMIVAVAMLTDYSLRQLIDMGKIANVNSYETLMEAAFGRPGFIFVSVSMFFLSYGTMVAYLLIIKDVLPVLFHVAPHDVGIKRIIMFVSSLLVIVPLSMQRDMADLEKTSRLNVFLDICLVALVVVFSPAVDNADGGILQTILDEPLLDLKTFFVGFGVCSFAFVCQDSSFIIAGSMVKPSKQRWKKVTRGAMLTCCTLELITGISGYLAYRTNTLGNVLNNMSTNHWSGVVARAMLSTTMFLAYPMNLYIARHAIVVLVFQGTPAHEGMDSVALMRFDRRATLTWALYAASVIPAMLMESTGKVLAVTGAIAGSCIAYIGPGLAFLAIHSSSFIPLVHNRWKASSKYLCGYPEKPGGKEVGAETPQYQNLISEEAEQHSNQKTRASVLDIFCWYIFGMPIWSTIAICGQSRERHREKEVMMPKRLASNPNCHRNQTHARSSFSSFNSAASDGDAEQVMLLQQSPGSTYGTNTSSGRVKIEPENDVPKWVDFRIAIAYVVLGVVAMIFGMISICLQ